MIKNPSKEIPIGAKNLNLISMTLKKEIKNIQSSSSDLKKFGFVIGAILLGFSALLFFTNKSNAPYLFSFGLILVILGNFLPSSLKILYRLWMAFSLIIGWLVSKIILSIIFFFVFTPISILAKLFRKDFLRIRSIKTKSYWVNRKNENYKKHSAENQF